MNYSAAINDFFKSPKWITNVLLAGLCCFIPIVGPMAVTGWLIAGFWLREDESFETFPEFTFNFFGRDLERGLWPVLAEIILMVVVVPIIWIGSLVILFFCGGFSHHGPGLMGYVALFFTAVLSYVVLAMAMAFYSPIYLRAARLQDLGSAFNLAYAKKFLSVMTQECLMAGLTLFCSMVLMLILFIIPCVACLAYPLLPFFIAFWAFVYFHLANQLYKLYLTRGGEALPLSPKLTNPPAPPASMPPSAPLPPA